MKKGNKIKLEGNYYHLGYNLEFFFSLLANFVRNPISITNYFHFLNDLWRYKKLSRERNYKFYLYPHIWDRTEKTPLGKEYFLQDTWCAGKIFKTKPKYHVDIGSTALLVGILAKFTKVYSVDIRPIPIKMKNLVCKKGSILKLPFKNNALKSISSLCVIEHIGLGRYGDTLNLNGTLQAVAELKRVLNKGGNLYLSVPITRSNTVMFNAHRTFNYKTILNYFKELKLVEMKFIFGGKIYSLKKFHRHFDNKKIIFGLFHFGK